MGRLVWLALLLLTAAPAAAGAAERRPATRECATTGRSLAGSAQVRVYEDTRGRVFACSLENGRRLLLGDSWTGGSSGSARVNPLAVAGRLVAWQPQYCVPLDGCDRTHLTIANVFSGKRKMRRPLPGLAVTELVLRPNGSAAWIESVDGRRTLRRRDPSGEAVLAEGDVRALALSPRSTLYWTEGGRARSAELAPRSHPAPPDPRRPICGEPGDTVVASAWARIWDDGTSVYTACSPETGETYDLGESSTSSAGDERVGPFAVAGRLFAVGHKFCIYSLPGPENTGTSCESNSINVRDARDGKSRRFVEVPRDLYVDELLLKRNTSLAFTQSREVRIVDGAGDRVAGEGADLALGKKSVVYWTRPDGFAAAVPLE